MRKVPRPFKMPFGKGMVVEEASITSKYHEPTIQLLKFDNGDKVIRFCSHNKGKFNRSPLIIDASSTTIPLPNSILNGRGTFLIKHRTIPFSLNHYTI